MALAAAAPPRPSGHAETHRIAGTTVYVVAHPLATTELRVVRMRAAAPLQRWCAAAGVAEAIVGGFFVRGGRHDLKPLGELRTRGIPRRTRPFDAPWGAIRACVASAGDEIRIARRPALGARPRGDLLQAGPLLVDRGRAVAGEDDAEGFSAGWRQFDSDITAGPHPRAALALAGRHLLAVACDGRGRDEAGLTLTALAEALVDLGTTHALNLDGGGSTSLVTGGELRNLPREGDGNVIAGGRAIPTAIAFLPR